MTQRISSRDVLPVQELLADSFNRISQLVANVLDGASDAIVIFRPDPEANSVGWLLWHLTRIQDDHVQDLAGAEQVWTADGWSGRFGLPFGDGDTGYGHTSSQVGEVAVARTCSPAITQRCTSEPWRTSRQSMPMS